MKQTTFTLEIASLLKTCNLPAKDLAGNKSVLFLEERIDNKLAGVVGIEIFGSTGLLRSLAVSKSYRGNGLGSKLVRHTEKQAVDIGIHTLWLLTDSASDFFKLLGYEKAERSSAPEKIRQSTQFSDLCPASAVLMKKKL